MPKPYTLVFLDADETLFDFRRAEEFALARSFEESGLTLTDRAAQEYERINIDLWRRLEHGEIDQQSLRSERFRLLFEVLGIARDARDFGETYVSWLARASFLLDGAERLCAYLGARYRLAILTNGIKEVQYARIQSSPINRYVEKLIVSEEAGSSKPDPAIFEYACAALEFRDRKRMIIIGDSLSSDIRGGQNFGIDTCWYNPAKLPLAGEARPTYEVASLEEIEGLL